MEQVYTKPRLAKYGNSLDVIKGECGWGIENAFLDETGAYNTTRYKWVFVSRTTLLAGPWYDHYECRSASACSNSSDEC